MKSLKNSYLTFYIICTMTGLVLISFMCQEKENIHNEPVDCTFTVNKYWEIDDDYWLRTPVRSITEDSMRIDIYAEWLRNQWNLCFTLRRPDGPVPLHSKDRMTIVRSDGSKYTSLASVPYSTGDSTLRTEHLHGIYTSQAGIEYLYEKGFKQFRFYGSTGTIFLDVPLEVSRQLVQDIACIRAITSDLPL